MARLINRLITTKRNTQQVHPVDTRGIVVSGQTRYYKNIAERDAVNSGSRPTFAWVDDATADPTVNQGSALYINKSGEWIKLYETESMDVELTFSLDWNQLLGKPQSSADAIDLAVTAAHTHENKAALNRITITEDGELMVDNKIVGQYWLQL